MELPPPFPRLYIAIRSEQPLLQLTSTVLFKGVEPTKKGWSCWIYDSCSCALYLEKSPPSVKRLHSERGDEILSLTCCTDHLSLAGLLWNMVKSVAFSVWAFSFNWP